LAPLSQARGHAPFSFAEQQAIVREALDRARKLLSFWVQHRARLGYGETAY
jgi:hypothetical protein